jgi:hypothetical protein
VLDARTHPTLPNINTHNEESLCGLFWLAEVCVCLFRLQTRTRYQILIHFCLGFPVGDIFSAFDGKDFWGSRYFVSKLGTGKIARPKQGKRT